MTSRLIVYGVMSIIILALVGIGLYYLLAYGNLRLDLIPTDTIAIINGHSYKTEKSIRLRSGHYTAKLASEGFFSKEISFDIRVGGTKNIKTFLSLDPNSPVGLEKLNRESSIKLEYEARVGHSIDQGVENIRSSTPLVNELPYIETAFRVDYGVSQKSSDSDAVAIYITAASVQGRQAALDWIKSKGYDPAKLEIIYQ